MRRKNPAEEEARCFVGCVATTTAVNDVRGCGCTLANTVSLDTRAASEAAVASKRANAEEDTVPRLCSDAPHSDDAMVCASRYGSLDFVLVVV